jgi:hypothetical protein
MVFLCRADLKPDLKTAAEWTGQAVLKGYQSA